MVEFAIEEVEKEEKAKKLRAGGGEESETLFPPLQCIALLKRTKAATFLSELTKYDDLSV